jgi:hypothetical protein
MPNYVKHRIWAQGPSEDLSNLIEQYFSDYVDVITGQKQKNLDFEKIIPSPTIVKETESSSDADFGAYLLQVLSGEAAYDLGYDKKINRSQGEDVSLTIKRFLSENLRVEHSGEMQLRCFKETGCKDWYDWNVKYWGTKWNCMEGKIEAYQHNDETAKLEFTMETAWNPPEPIFQKLAELFPNIKFEVICFDELWNFAASGTFNATRDFDGLSFYTPSPNQHLWRDYFERVYGFACPPIEEEEDENEDEDEAEREPITSNHNQTAGNEGEEEDGADVQPFSDNFD